MDEINMMTEIMIRDNYDGEGYTTFDFCDPYSRPSWDYQEMLYVAINEYIDYNLRCLDVLDDEYLIGDDYDVEDITLTTSINGEILEQYTYDLAEWNIKDLADHFVTLNEKALMEIGVDYDKNY